MQIFWNPDYSNNYSKIGISKLLFFRVFCENVPKGNQVLTNQAQTTNISGTNANEMREKLVSIPNCEHLLEQMRVYRSVQFMKCVRLADSHSD